MDTLRALLVGVALLASSSAHADPSDVRIERWRPFIIDAAARFGIPEDWIVRVMRAESGGRTQIDGRPITSSAGAMGLMQLMPGTWSEVRAANGLGSDPHDPRDNILAGVAYLRLLHDRFGYPGLFSAYNAGPGRYAEHLAAGRPLPDETRAYLATVTPSESAATQTADGPMSGLFFRANMSPTTAAAVRGSSPPNTLFAILKPAGISPE